MKSSFKTGKLSFFIKSLLDFMSNNWFGVQENKLRWVAQKYSKWLLCSKISFTRIIEKFSILIFLDYLQFFDIEQNVCVAILKHIVISAKVMKFSETYPTKIADDSSGQHGVRCEGIVTRSTPKLDSCTIVNNKLHFIVGQISVNLQTTVLCQWYLSIPFVFFFGNRWKCTIPE